MQSISLSLAEEAEGVFLSGERLQLESRSRGQAGRARNPCSQMGKQPALPSAGGLEANLRDSVCVSATSSACIWAGSLLWVGRSILFSGVLSRGAGPRVYK